jgi:hypothetical protein
MGTKNFEVEVNGQKDKGHADLTMATTRSPRRVHLLHELTFINLFTVSILPPTPPTPTFKLSLRSGSNHHETTATTTQSQHKHTTEHSPNEQTGRTNDHQDKPSQRTKRTPTTAQHNESTTAAPKQKETTFIKFSQLIMLPLSIPHPSRSTPPPSIIPRKKNTQKKKRRSRR